MIQSLRPHKITYSILIPGHPNFYRQILLLLRVHSSDPLPEKNAPDTTLASIKMPPPALIFWKNVMRIK